MGFDPTPIRAVFFEKSSSLNWSLPWHQDRVVIMSDRTDDPTYSNWSKKEGFWHCEPPISTLKEMAFAYIALDSIASGSGGLELAEGTHNHGRITAPDINNCIANTNIATPTLKTGDVLFVQALTLHRSVSLKGAQRRRALRLDFRCGRDRVPIYPRTQS
jgi:ectoine hydroxylase-related dioxygenase (phytanoyl-CoA dioxygenase family)